MADLSQARPGFELLHPDIFHGACEQYYETEQAVYLGAVGLLQPVLDLATYYAGEGIEDGVRALLRVRDWSRAADSGQLGRIDLAVAECLNQLPEARHLRTFRAIAVRETHNYLPEQELILLGQVLAEQPEAETVSRRATAQILAHLAQTRPADDGLINRSFEVAIGAGPRAVEELIGRYTAAVMPGAFQAAGATLSRGTVEQIIWAWVCQGRLSEARILTNEVLARFGESSWQAFWMVLDESRDGTPPDTVEVGRLTPGQIVALAVSAAREGYGATATWLRERAEERLGREIDTMRREHRFEAFAPEFGQMFHDAAASAAWCATLYSLLGDVAEADRAMSLAASFTREGDQGFDTWRMMGGSDSRGDTIAREAEDATSLRLRREARAGWYLWLGGETSGGQEAIRQVVQELGRLENPGVVSPLAGDVAEVATTTGLLTEAVQAVGHVVNEWELRFAQVAGLMAAAAGGARRQPPEFDELVLRVAQSGRQALTAAGPLAIASGGAGIDEVREETEAWLTSQATRDEGPALAGWTQPTPVGPDPAARAQAEERWDDLVSIQAAELSRARLAPVSDSARLRDLRRRLSRALWQARRYEEETAVWRDALAESIGDEADLARRELSESLVHQGRLDEAVDLWRAVVTAADGCEKPDARRSDEYLRQLSLLYRLADRWDDLAGIWSTALSRALDAGDTGNIHRYEQELVWAYQRAGQPNRAAEVWRAGLARAAAEGDLDAADFYWEKRSRSYGAEDWRDASTRLWIEALAQARAAVPPDQERIRRCLDQLRVPFLSGEAPAEVLAAWSEELAAALARGDQDAADDAREELAAGYRHGDRYADEAQLWRDALEAATPISEQAARYRTSLDRSLRRLNQPDELIALWHAAVSDVRQVDADFTVLEAALRELAGAYAFAERPDEEITVWIGLLDAAREQTGHSVVEFDNHRRNLAAAYRRAGRPADEARVWLDALDEAEQPPGWDPSRVSALRDELIGAYRAAGRLDDLAAVVHDERAAALARGETDRADTVGRDLAYALQSAGRAAESAQVWTELAAEASQRPDAGEGEVRNLWDWAAGTYRDAQLWDELIGFWRQRLSDMGSTDQPGVDQRHIRQKLLCALGDAERWGELTEFATAELAAGQQLGDANRVFDARAALAGQYERGGRFAEAAELWREALAEAQASGAMREYGIRHNLISALEHGRMWDELIELRRAKMAETGDDKARAELAGTYRKAGRARQEAQLWADAVAEAQRLDPPDEQRISKYRGALAEAYRHGGLWSELVAFWRALLAEAEAEAADTDSQALDHFRVQLAAAQLQAGHGTEAIAILQEAVADARAENDGDPGRVDACMAQLAAALNWIEQYDESLDVLQQRYAEARDSFGAAGPRTIQAGRDLANAEVCNRNSATAITLLRDLTAQPAPPRLLAAAHNDLGNALLYDDQVAAAEAGYRQATEHGDYRNRADFAANLAFVLRLLGRLPEAEEVLRKHATSWARPGDTAPLAHILLLQGRFDDAERLLLDDTSHNPRDGWPRALLALARDRTDQAIEECAALAGHRTEWWLMAHLIARPGDAGQLPSPESAVALDLRAKQGYYQPPFSRAEVAAITLSVAGRPADGARLLKQAVPLRLPGERWHLPAYELLKSRTGVDLSSIEAIWESVRRQDPQCTQPWNSDDE